MHENDYFPAEIKYEALCLFSQKEFLIEKALQEYHPDPIGFALALAELNKEMFEAAHHWIPTRLKTFVDQLRVQRRARDVLGEDGYLYNTWFESLSLLQIFRFLRAGLIELLNYRFERIHYGSRKREIEDAWECRFRHFCNNVNLFCQYAGSEVDTLALPRETINNLRKFAADRRQELAPLLEVNARLNKELTSYKRINAALQTRHTIEKLVFQLPDTPEYDFPGSGPKWKALWDQIWADASGIANNPFHNLWNQATGDYARNNIRDKGRTLFADMSGEIHGYDGRRGNEPRQGIDFDYEHFDASARKVATTLHGHLSIDQSTGEVDWTQAIRRYPIQWPTADDLSLSKRLRLEARVMDLDQRLQDAKEKLNEHLEEILGGGHVQAARRENIEANQAVQNNESFGIGDLFGSED
jgi:hypothetical protein